MHRLSAVLVTLFLSLTIPAAHAQTAKKGGAEKLPAIAVLSIIPAQAEPGMTVTMSGTGFTDRTVAFLGSSQLPTRVINPKLLSVDIPDLAPGLYALFLKREDGSTSKPYNFLIQPLKPVVAGLTPETVYQCARGREREVTVLGKNFLPGSQVIFDGGAIGTRFISSDSISFTAPGVAGGLHQVQVKNPSEAVSGSAALYIEGKPEIFNITVGNDFVNFYELIISGRNFTSDSVLVVDGDKVGSGRPAVGDRDRVIYIGCEQLIYQRYPYDPTAKEHRLQVQNPGGEGSSVISLSAP
ncbi:IPT/TIG domain-containing protein [Geomonas sp. RF6]|uniref:IPT/TIG domain-containing protein n=1 Tax=Geomonas sp. RF6 TaxID=2897342 RepID=UPI001E316AD9|nr:IPT/TIG domain-containing protein [Geomonas sp. RF6]UFS72735.1 IPT/TIG domain-containing protein [Geomonas sp. RF6]